MIDESQLEGRKSDARKEETYSLRMHEYNFKSIVILQTCHHSHMLPIQPRVFFYNNLLTFTVEFDSTFYLITRSSI